MFLSRKCLDYRSIKTFVRLYSLARKNHYDVLKLRKNCTDKEIKDAFIQMSKEYHPDKNKDAKAQEKFVRIVEAYNVLGKPSSRAQYDSLREIPTYGPTTTHYSYVHRPAPHNVRSTDYNFYYETHRYTKNYTYTNPKRNTYEKSTNNASYYGFAGVKKVPNYYIIGLCFGVAFLGVILQVYVIRNMYIAQRAQALEKSRRLAEELERVRAAARDNGNELQTRLLLDRIVSASNPTVATASLGQSLVEDKKDQIDNLLKEFGIGDSPERWFETCDVQAWDRDWDDPTWFSDSQNSGEDVD